MSADGTIIAISTPFNDGGGENSGHVRIYKRNGTPWDQLGTDIDGEAAHDYLAIEHGPAITMNAGGTIGDSVDLSFPVRQHSHAGCLVALGPVLRRRRTYDRCFERCAPAVPQHDRPRASTIPLPAHSPCTAASEQSTAAIDPCGDVGCLAGFRQEGSPPYMPCMRYSIKGDTKNWNSLTRYMIRADLDCVFGKS